MTKQIIFYFFLVQCAVCLKFQGSFSHEVQNMKAPLMLMILAAFLHDKSKMDPIHKFTSLSEYFCLSVKT